MASALLLFHEPIATASEYSFDPSTLKCDAIPNTWPNLMGQDGTHAPKVSISADEIDFPERGIAHLSGDTLLARGGYLIRADELIYNRAETIATAEGRVKLETHKGDVIYTNYLKYFVASGRVVTSKAHFIVTAMDPGHSRAVVQSYGTTNRITLTPVDVMVLGQVTITHCLDGKKLETLTTSELKVKLKERGQEGPKKKLAMASPDHRTVHRGAQHKNR